MQANRIRSLARSDVDSAGATMWRAFDDDPAWATVLDDPAQRERVYARMWPAVVRYSVKYGRARGIDGTVGVACWLPPGRTKITGLRAVMTGMWGMMLVLDSAKRKEFTGVLDHMDQVHERVMPEPHWYLQSLATDPARQGEGIGTRLLEDGYETAGPHPIYLEAITEDNTAYYERRDFEVVESGTIEPSGFPYWAMVRRG